MRYIFLGHMFPDVENDIKKMRVPPSVSGHKYTANLVLGLIENGQDVIVLNIPRIRYYPHYPRVFIHGSRFVLNGAGLGFNVGFVNLPVINYVTSSASLKRALRRLIKNLKGEDSVLICCEGGYSIVSSIVYIQRKFKRIHSVAVIGDLSGKYGTRTTLKGVKNSIANFFGNRTDRFIKEIDAYGFLTEFMPAAMGVQDKPYVVIEGMYSEIYSKSSESVNNTADSKAKIIFYAGAIREEYGLMHLLKAFSLIQGNEYRLYLAGGEGGDAVEEVKMYAKKDSRVTYLGFIVPSEVDKYQRSATVLVNPRTSEHLFVKYSFPSKNMECLASGKPYITHKLPCYPPEYDEYIQYPDDESDEALAQKIVEVCELPKEEREAIGRRAREFILREKNPKVQCKKIVDMMERM